VKEIRLHGRGGQGIATAAEILAAALVIDGKHAAAFPVFGFERRGAPVTAFVRLDEGPVRERTQVYNPDCIIVADPVAANWPLVYGGLKDGAVLVLNTPRESLSRPSEKLALMGLVDATKVAWQELGTPITATCMLGAFARTTGWVGLEAILKALEDYFRGRVLERNSRCVERGYQEVRVVRVSHAAGD